MTEILEEASSYRVNTALELSASESGAGENIGRTKIGPKSSISSFLGKSYMVPKAKCQLVLEKEVSLSIQMVLKEQ